MQWYGIRRILNVNALFGWIVKKFVKTILCVLENYYILNAEDVLVSQVSLEMMFDELNEQIDLNEFVVEDY